MNNPRKCKIKINSTYWTSMNGGIKIDQLSKIPEDSIEAEYWDTLDVIGFDTYSCYIDGMEWILHENDVTEVDDDDFLFEYERMLNLPDIPEKCCDNPNVIMNSIAKDIFYVCRNCKKEVTKDGYIV